MRKRAIHASRPNGALEYIVGIVGVLAIISVASLFFGYMTPTSAIVSTLTLTVTVLYVVGFILFSRQHWMDIKRTIRRKE